MYYDEYGRLRAANIRKPMVRARSFQEWQDQINPTSAAPTSAAPTSATPTSAGGTTDESQGAAAGGGSDGGDVADTAQHNMSLPEYDNIRDWVDAVMSSPNLMGPSMVADAIAGRGVFDPTMDRSYTTRSGELMNAGQPSYADIRSAKETNGAVTSANEKAGILDGDYDAAIASGNEAFSGETPGGPAAAGPNVETNDGTGWDMAEGGAVFNSPEQVPGPVAGPGGPKDDMVDANLSNGEFVSTAEATQTFGQDFLTQLNEIAKAPEAQGLMSNPAFEQTKQKFIQELTGLMAPAGGAPAPSGPPNPVGPPVDPMGAQGFADGGMINDPLGFIDDIENATNAGGARSAAGDGQPAKSHYQQQRDNMQNKYNKNVPATRNGSDPAKLGGTGVANDNKPRGLMQPMDDFFDWLMDKYDRMRKTGAGTINGDPAIEDKRSGPNPGQKQIDDPASKAKDVTPRTRGGVDSTPSPSPLGLMARKVPPAVTAFASTMTADSTPLNKGEDEALAEALKDPQRAMGNVKESRTKDDTEVPASGMSENMEKEAKSLFSKPKSKPAAKKKETAQAENKLSPNAGLGDALAFYKRKGADKFTWEGQTYVRSDDSPTGYVLN